MYSNSKRSSRKQFLLACALSLTIPSIVLADTKKGTPTLVSGVDVISVEQANTLLDKAIFYDMRPAVSYGRGHIKGAMAMPYNGKSENTENFDASKDQFDSSKLPADKEATLVFYSDCQTDWRSYKAAVQSRRAGYKNVKWLRDGVDGWYSKGLKLE